LKNFPLKPLYDYWKRVNGTLPATPLKLTHNFLLGLLALKKYRNTSTNDEWPKWWHRIEKALTNA